MGSFLPWATVTTVFGTASLNGSQGDGKITLVLSLIIVLLSVLELNGSSNTRVGALVLALIAVGVGGYDFINVNSKLPEASSEFAQASIGVGLYAVVGGGIVAVVGALMNR